MKQDIVEELNNVGGGLCGGHYEPKTDKEGADGALMLRAAQEIAELRKHIEATKNLNVGSYGAVADDNTLIRTICAMNIERIKLQAEIEERKFAGLHLDRERRAGLNARDLLEDQVNTLKGSLVTAKDDLAGKDTRIRKLLHMLKEIRTWNMHIPSARDGMCVTITHNVVKQLDNLLKDNE